MTHRRRPPRRPAPTPAPTPATDAAPAARAAASPVSEAEGKAFPSRWIKAQNSGDLAAYQDLYAGTMTGIRRSGKKNGIRDQTRRAAPRRH